MSLHPTRQGWHWEVGGNCRNQRCGVMFEDVHGPPNQVCLSTSFWEQKSWMPGWGVLDSWRYVGGLTSFIWKCFSMAKLIYACYGKWEPCRNRIAWKGEWFWNLLFVWQNYNNLQEGWAQKNMHYFISFFFTEHTITPGILGIYKILNASGRPRNTLRCSHSTE